MTTKKVEGIIGDSLEAVVAADGRVIGYLHPTYDLQYRVAAVPIDAKSSGGVDAVTVPSREAAIGYCEALDDGPVEEPCYSPDYCECPSCGACDCGCSTSDQHQVRAGMSMTAPTAAELG